MDLKQLRYFSVIAESGSLSKASERLHVAQPALSLHLAKLEGELGVQLMLRNNRGVVLTEHGESMLKHAQRILKDCETTVGSFRAASVTPVGDVSVGFPSTTPDAFAQVFIERMHRDYPRISLHLLESNSDRLEEFLREGVLDFAIVMLRRATAGFDVQPLLFQDLFLVSPRPADATAAGGEIDFREVCGLPLFLPHAGNSLRDLIDEVAIGLGESLVVVHEVDAARFMKSAVLSGIGHTILPWGQLEDEREQRAFQLRRIVNPPLRALVGLAESTVRPGSHARLVVKRVLAEIVTGLVREGMWSAQPYSDPRAAQL